MKATIAIAVLTAVAGMADAKLVKVNSRKNIEDSGKPSVKGIHSQHHRNLNNDCGTCMSACNNNIDPPGCRQSCKNNECRPKGGGKSVKMYPFPSYEPDIDGGRNLAEKYAKGEKTSMPGNSD